MRFLIALFLLLLFCGAVVAVVTWLQQSRRAFKSRKPAKWVYDEDPDGEQVIVSCVEEGTGEKLLVGAAAFAAKDFDMQLEELRSEAAYRLVTLNARRHLKS